MYTDNSLSFTQDERGTIPCYYQNRWINKWQLKVDTLNNGYREHKPTHYILSPIFQLLHSLIHATIVISLYLNTYMN